MKSVDEMSSDRQLGFLMAWLRHAVSHTYLNDALPSCKLLEFANNRYLASSTPYAKREPTHSPNPPKSQSQSPSLTSPYKRQIKRITHKPIPFHPVPSYPIPYPPTLSFPSLQLTPSPPTIHPPSPLHLQPYNQHDDTHTHPRPDNFPPPLRTIPYSSSSIEYP